MFIYIMLKCRTNQQIFINAFRSNGVILYKLSLYVNYIFIQIMVL